VWSDDRRVTASGPNPDVYHDRVAIAPAVTVSPSVLEGGNPASGTVTLAAPAPVGGTSVTLSSNNPGVVSVPASVVVPAAALSASFTVTTTPVTAQTPVTVTATFPGGVTRATVITVLASPTVSSLSLSPTTVVGGQDSTGTVTLSGPAPAGGSNVALTSSHPSVATVPASLAIPAGESSGTFTVTTVGAVASVSVTITAGLNGTSRSAGLTVTEAPGNASFDPVLLAPRCNTVESFCDTGPTLVRGRDNMSGGAEPNAPNTILASCADGASGSFHSDESLDRLRISTTDGTALQAGKTVRIDATVWVFSATSNWLDLFFAPDANGPVWAPIATLQATA
jgi:hypothetical protein